MTKFVDKNWAKWQKNVEPIIMTHDEEKKRRATRRKSVFMNLDEANEMKEEAEEEDKEDNDKGKQIPQAA